MTRLAQRTQQFGGCLALLAIVAGVPTVVARIGRWPFPNRFPSWRRISTAVQQGDIPANTVIKILAVAVWIARLQLMWALIWELVINVPRANRGQRTRPVPMVPRSIGNGMGRLVAIVLSVGLVASSTRALALAPAAGTPLAHRNSAIATLVTSAPTPQRQFSDPVRDALLHWHVTTRDSLWSIAESALGDGSRVHEIIDLNPGINSPRDIHAGVVLTLPRDATVPANRQQPAPLAATDEPAPPEPVPNYAPQTTITVVRGDTLWDLSKTQLHTAGLATPSGHDIVSYLEQVVAANPTIIDPNLIYPGKQFDFPAVGQPPPAPPAPPLPAAEPQTGTPEAPPSPITTTQTTTDETRTTPVAAAPTPTATGTAPATSLSITTITNPEYPTSTAPTEAATVETAATATNVTSPDSTRNLLAGVSGSTVLASALLVAHRRRRTRQATRGTRHTIGRRADPTTTVIERSLVAAADVALVAWANQQLLDLFNKIDPKRIAAGRVASELSETTGIELLWEAQNPPPPKPWTSHDGGWTYRLAYDPDAVVVASSGAAALPGLVTVGTRHGNPLLIDLEAFGTLHQRPRHSCRRPCAIHHPRTRPRRSRLQHLHPHRRPRPRCREKLTSRSDQRPRIRTRPPHPDHRRKPPTRGRKPRQEHVRPSRDLRTARP